jgi:site-specific DNA-methyltransferase (adenine-specific)
MSTIEVILNRENQMQLEKGKVSTNIFDSIKRISHGSILSFAKSCEKLHWKRYIRYIENPIPQEFIDRIIPKSSEKMEELPDNSIHLMVTSPPHRIHDKDFDLDEYRAFLKVVWSEVKRVLVPGGRVCINIADIERNPYIPLHVFVIEDMLELGFLMRNEIIWNKVPIKSPQPLGSNWLPVKNPTLRNTHEYILVFSKDTFSRRGYKKEETISREEFLEFSKSVWTFSDEDVVKNGHPESFPVELPYRLIQLYTYKGEVVLDPFMGSGQTAIAAIRTQRHYIGYEVNNEYISLAKRRLNGHFCLPCTINLKI